MLLPNNITYIPFIFHSFILKYPINVILFYFIPLSYFKMKKKKKLIIISNKKNVNGKKKKK